MGKKVKKKERQEAKYIHNACHDACCGCPQFRGYDADNYFHEFGKFRKIPNKGMAHTLRFWLSEPSGLLWGKGYYVELPQGVQDIFNEVRGAMDAAIDSVSYREQVR